MTSNCGSTACQKKACRAITSASREALVEEDQAEGQQRAQGAEADDLQPAAADVAQPAPEIRRQTAHQHRNGDQLADALRREPQMGEVQAEKRRRRTEQREVEEIEPGEAPVRSEAVMATGVQFAARGVNAGAPRSEWPLKADPAPASSPAHRHSVRGGAAGDPAARWPSSPRRSGWRGCRRRGRGDLGDHVHRLAIHVDGATGRGDAGRRLERQMGDDRLTRGDATENAAGIVGQKALRVSSSRCSVPRWATDAKPAPISTPLTALMLISAWASSASGGRRSAHRGPAAHPRRPR